MWKPCQCDGVAIANAASCQCCRSQLGIGTEDRQHWQHSPPCLPSTLQKPRDFVMATVCRLWPSQNLSVFEVLTVDRAGSVANVAGLQSQFPIGCGSIGNWQHWRWQRHHTGKASTSAIRRRLPVRRRAGRPSSHSPLPFVPLKELSGAWKAPAEKPCGARERAVFGSLRARRTGSGVFRL